MEHEKAPILKANSMQEIEIPNASDKLELLPMKTVTSCNSACRFSRQQQNSVVASNEATKSAKKLSLLIVFYAIVMVVEVIGGLKSHSLAVISDAAHLLSDIAGFAISLFAVWASGWEATPHQSFGYNRLEVLGALLSVQLIWFISGFLIYEAVGRLVHQNARVNGKLMFPIAAFGFVLNFIMVIWLGHDHSHHHHGFGDSSHDHGHGHGHGQCCRDSHHEHGVKEELPKIMDEETLIMLPSSQRNINLQGAYLHVMTDMIQSIGVMIAGGIIWAEPEWFMVDLLCTIIFSLLSLSTTLPMLRSIFGILMERTPSEINLIQLQNGLQNIKGVQEVHDLHVWAITVGKNYLSCHVVVESGISSIDLIATIKDYCEKNYRIQHVTIQIE